MATASLLTVRQMQVNHAMRFKHPGQRLRLERFLSGLSDLRPITLDGPSIDPDRPPRWTSVVFSADHGNHADLVARVEFRIAEAGAAEHFENWP